MLKVRPAPLPDLVCAPFNPLLAPVPGALGTTTASGTTGESARPQIPAVTNAANPLLALVSDVDGDGDEGALTLARPPCLRACGAPERVQAQLLVVRLLSARSRAHRVEVLNG